MRVFLAIFSCIAAASASTLLQVVITIIVIIIILIIVIFLIIFIVIKAIYTATSVIIVTFQTSQNLGKPSFKKYRNFMKNFHKRGGGLSDFISLIQK